MSDILIRHAFGENFGDGSNHYLFKKYISNIKSENCWNTNNKIYNNKTILGMGSIIDKVNKNDIVCGSGMISPTAFPKFKPNELKEIVMVRGPLTYNSLVNKGYKVKKLYGDPGLLFSDIYKSKSIKKYNIGIIPHFIDKQNMNVKKLISSGCKFIDVQQAQGNEEKFLDEINECNIIFSSSLHGIIIGDSYSIPSFHIKFSDKLSGGSFKFEDYYMSVDRTYSYLDASGNLNLNDLYKFVNTYKCNYDTDLIKNTIKNLGNNKI
jgi:pyruvyltransferase